MGAGALLSGRFWTRTNTDAAKSPGRQDDCSCSRSMRRPACARDRAVVAAPFCTRLFGDLGADVIKIEPLKGDPVRRWGGQVEGKPVWWSNHGRNKRSVRLNLEHPKAAGIVLHLAGNVTRGSRTSVRATGEARARRSGPAGRASGSRIVTAAPSNPCPSSDGKWILIAANSDPLFARLAKLIGHPDPDLKPRFSSNLARVENVIELDVLIANWTQGLSAEEIDRRLTRADIPCTRVYTAVEIAADPQFRHRGMVREVEDAQLGRVLHSGIVPHIPEAPGSIRWPGPAVGAHTDEVLAELIGLAPAEIAALREDRVI